VTGDDVQTLNDGLLLLAGDEAAAALDKADRAQWPAILADWVRRVVERQGKEALGPLTDEVLGRWVCEAFNCREQGDHRNCSTRSRADMIASRRLMERAAHRARCQGNPLRALSPDGALCDVCVVCGTLLLPGPPPRCEGCPDPDDLEDDELHVPREQW